MEVRPLSTKSNYCFTESDLKITLMINPFTKYLAGHSIRPFALGNYTLSNNIQYITLLRDPIRRYVSQYNFWFTKWFPSSNFDDFLSLDDLYNFQTKKIAGSEDLTMAKEILKKRFLVVGLVEDFDEFLVLLKRKLKPMTFDTRYVIHNVADNVFTINSLIKRYHEKIVEKNLIDLELYEYVKNELGEKQRDSYGSGFKKDLAQHRSNNFPPKKKMRDEFDYRSRICFERITGLIRYANGLPARGNY